MRGETEPPVDEPAPAEGSDAPADPSSPPPAGLVGALERIVVAGVGLTTLSLATGSGGAELTMPQWRVLMLLGRDADGVRVSQVAGALGVTLPATGRQLRRLAWRGLLVLEPDAHDRRVTRARLTAVGWALRSAVIAERRRSIEEAIERVDRTNAAAAALDAVADALEDVLEARATRRRD